MNSKQLAILLVLVAVIGGAGLVIHNKHSKSWEGGDMAAGKKVLGDDFKVNDVTQITIKHETNEVNLVKKDGTWRVGERDDYSANFPEISQFLLKVSDLKAVQTEKVGPSHLARLELASGDGTNSATEVEFKGDGGKAIRTLLLGKSHLKEPSAGMAAQGSPGWPDGRWVKLADSSYVDLISDPLESAKSEPDSWLDKEFFHVQKPKSIEVTYPVETNSWKLTRETESGTWKLADAKADEKLDSSKTSGVTSPFSSPSFTDVMHGDKLDGAGTNKPTVVKIETFDHFAYTVKIGQKTNDDYLLTMNVSADLPKERTPGKDEKPADKEKLDKAFKDEQQKQEDKLKKEQALADWTYMVPTWSVDQVLKKRSELLEEPKKKETKVTDAGSKMGNNHKADPSLPASPPK